MKKRKFKKIIYISHPYGGKENNKKEIEHIVNLLSALLPDYLFLSPVHAFGFQYDVLTYEDGLNKCLWLLDQSNEMWVYGNYWESKGCRAEIAYCEKKKIKCKFGEPVLRLTM